MVTVGLLLLTGALPPKYTRDGIYEVDHVIYQTQYHSYAGGSGSYGGINSIVANNGGLGHHVWIIATLVMEFIY